MEIACTLLLCLAILLDSIDLGSQFNHLPDGGHYSDSSQQPAELTDRSRSRSPTLRQIFPTVLGFRFEDLELIRLFPHHNPNRIFELRRYVFPPDIPIRLRRNKYGQSLMPTGEQIVLTTPNGDVCALLDKTSYRSTILRAFSTLTPMRRIRAKINMNSGEVAVMAPEEIEECPVSTREVITKSYGVFRLSPPPPSPFASSSSPAEPPLRARSSSPPLQEKFPRVLGYRFKDLPLLRLSPYDYPHKIFEFRIYAFPTNNQIRLRTKYGVLDPMPTGDQIVLSTSNGDVCAILLKSLNKKTSLRPILSTISGIVKRVKMNIRSGAVDEMTTQEISECPATAGEPITKTYKIFNL